MEYTPASDKCKNPAAWLTCKTCAVSYPNLYVDFAISKALDFAFAQVDAQIAGNFSRESLSTQAQNPQALFQSPT
jgi:hypothetical protein